MITILVTLLLLTWTALGFCLGYALGRATRRQEDP